jgi:hypothetical protein
LKTFGTVTSVHRLGGWLARPLGAGTLAAGWVPSGWPSNGGGGCGGAGAAAWARISQPLDRVCARGSSAAEAAVGSAAMAASAGT